LKPANRGEPFQAPIPAQTPMGSYCTICCVLAPCPRHMRQSMLYLVHAIHRRMLLSSNLISPPCIILSALVRRHHRLYPDNVHLNASTVMPYTNFATMTGCPMHLLSQGASSSACSSNKSANFNMALLRCAGFHVDHSPLKAARAAATAASTSAWPAAWMLSATRDSSWGLYTLSVSPDLASTYYSFVVLVMFA
jgi:hypothetical protein